MSLLRTWRRLTPRERCLVARAALLLPGARVCLRGVRTVRVMERFCGPAPAAPAGPGAGAEIEAVQKAVRLARRGWGWTNCCLPEALVACRLLRRAGFPARIRFGVQRGGPAGIDAHAWVEVDGVPGGVNWDAQFQEFLAPAAPRRGEESQGRS